MNAVDTNILVYAIDESEPKKGQVALQLLESLSARDTILPWQVLCEFGAVMVRFEQQGTLRLAPADVVESIQKRFPVVLPDPRVVHSALRLIREVSISYWDAMLVAACAAAGANRLFTEDLSDGAVIGGVRIINPLKSPAGTPNPG